MTYHHRNGISQQKKRKDKMNIKKPFYCHLSKSGVGVVGNTLDYQSRDRKIDPPLPQSCG